MKNNQDIGSALKSKLEDLHNSPDEFVWDAIEDKLKKKKRRLLFWYFTFGLGILILALYIFNPFNNFNESDINGLKSQEQKIEIVDQEDYSNPSTETNFEDKDSNQPTNATLNTNNELSSVDVSSTKNLSTQNNRSSSNFKTSKNVYGSIISSENQKLDKAQPNQQKSDVISQSSNLDINTTKSSTITDKKDLKSTQINTQIENDKIALRERTERVSDSLLKTKDDVVTISEEEEKKDVLDENKKVKDSLIERLIKWSINPQLIISNYGAFSTKTKDNTSINYGLLLGAQITHNTFLRVGVRKLDLMQTVNNSNNSVSYLEFPLEAKYIFSDNTFNPYLTGGLSYFKLDGKSTESLYNLEYDDTMSLNLGLGIEHKLFDRFYINLESNFNYLIKPISTNIDYTPYIFSISSGIDYRF